MHMINIYLYTYITLQNNMHIYQHTDKNTMAQWPPLMRGHPF